MIYEAVRSHVLSYRKVFAEKVFKTKTLPTGMTGRSRASSAMIMISWRSEKEIGKQKQQE